LGRWRVADTWSVAVERTTAAGWAAELQLRRGLPLRSQRVRGDAAALAAVYERHHQALYRYCRSILRDEEEARDALQSTMAKALAALREEQRDFEVRPWLFRIAHNEAISRLRRRREVADPDAVAAASIDSLAQTIEDRERLAHLHADLRDLPERQRAALVLRELSGLSHEEIAGVLDSTARAVKQTIFEARVALQECAEGREMVCHDVQRALSDGDGRVLRGRKLRAHVRSCRECRQFKTALSQRPADLALLAPGLPAAAGSALLAHLLPGAKAGAASSVGTATGVGGGLAGTVATKAAVVVAATAALAGTTTAVRQVVEPSHRATAPPAQPAVKRAAHAHAAQTPFATTGQTAHDAHGSSAQRGGTTRTHRQERKAAGQPVGAATKAAGRHGKRVTVSQSHAATPTARGNGQAVRAHGAPAKKAKSTAHGKPAKSRAPKQVHPSPSARSPASPPAAASHGASTQAAPQAATGAGDAAAADLTTPDHGAASAASSQQVGAHSS
jgi:RNA polymerase sigma factor (sigma-70 family)